MVAKMIDDFGNGIILEIEYVLYLNHSIDMLRISCKHYHSVLILYRVSWIVLLQSNYFMFINF